MADKPNLTFRLASPQYRRFLDFITTERDTTPGKLFNAVIRDETYAIMDERASREAHRKLTLESGLPLEAVSWILGSRSDHWAKLAAVIGMEKTVAYQNEFSPLWERLIGEIDKVEGLNYFDLESRNELADSEQV